MKKCPYCHKGNDDDEIQCWNCGEWFDTLSPSQKKVDVKPSKKEGSRVDHPIDWQTKLNRTLNEYNKPIISIIIVTGLLFIILQMSTSNKSAKQVTGVEPPSTDTPAAPAPGHVPAPEAVSTPETVPVPESAPALGSAVDLYNKALSLCEGAKCTDPQKAIEYLNEAINLQPNFANAYGARGNAYSNQKQYQKAIEDYNKAIQLRSNNVVFFNNRGNVYKDLNKYQLAVEDYNEAIRLKPNNLEAYHNRGNAYFMQGKYELGCPDAQKACELGNCQLLEWAKDKKYCH